MSPPVAIGVRGEVLVVGCRAVRPVCSRSVRLWFAFRRSLAAPSVLVCSSDAAGGVGCMRFVRFIVLGVGLACVGVGRSVVDQSGETYVFLELCVLNC